MNAQELDWNGLKLVRAVAQTGSLSGAARVLGINHATVFRRLGALEEALEVRLFERHSKGYVPTPAGERAVQAAEQMEGHIHALLGDILGQDLRLQGEIRIASTDLMFRALLMPHISAFSQRYPDVRFTLDTSSAVLDLGRREADVAVRVTHRPPETLVGRKLGLMQNTWYASEGYLAQHAPEDPARHQWLLPEGDIGQLPSVAWLAARHPEARPHLRSNTLQGLLSAALADLGVAPLPCFIGDAQDALRRLYPPAPELDCEVWLLIHPDLRRTARIRAFSQFLAQALAEDPTFV